MDRERRDEGKEVAPTVASEWGGVASRGAVPGGDAAYQAQCDARVVQFMSGPLPLTPSEREAREAGGAAGGGAAGGGAVGALSFDTSGCGCTAGNGLEAGIGLAIAVLLLRRRPGTTPPGTSAASSGRAAR